MYYENICIVSSKVLAKLVVWSWRFRIAYSYNVPIGVDTALTISHWPLQKWVVIWVLKWPREIGQVLWVHSFRVESEEMEPFDITRNKIFPLASKYLSIFNKCSYSWLNMTFFGLSDSSKILLLLVWFLKPTCWFIQSPIKTTLICTIILVPSFFTRFCSGQLFLGELRKHAGY